MRCTSTWMKCTWRREHLTPAPMPDQVRPSDPPGPTFAAPAERFRLFEIRVMGLRHLPGAVRRAAREMGWLRALYGLDLWLNEIPVFRTAAALVALYWLATKTR